MEKKLKSLQHYSLPNLCSSLFSVTLQQYRFSPLTQPICSALGSSLPKQTVFFLNLEIANICIKFHIKISR